MQCSLWALTHAGCSVVGPGHSSLENLPPCQTIFDRQNVNQSMRAFAYPTNNYHHWENYWVQPLDIAQQWPINEQLVLASCMFSDVSTPCSKIIFSYIYSLDTEFRNCSFCCGNWPAVVKNFSFKMWQLCDKQ